MENKEYKYLIYILEKRKNNLVYLYGKNLFFKNLIKLYIYKYDELLLKLYSKYLSKI